MNGSKTVLIARWPGSGDQATLKPLCKGMRNAGVQFRCKIPSFDVSVSRSVVRLQIEQGFNPGETVRKPQLPTRNL